MRGGGGQKMSVHDQGIKTVHAGGGGGGMAKFVHVVVECPPRALTILLFQA